MYKLLRFYNQNRKKLWFIVAIVVFVLIIIQLLNNVAKQQNQEEIIENIENIIDTDKIQLEVSPTKGETKVMKIKKQY